jgi:polyadenylation factor subunit 2
MVAAGSSRGPDTWQPSRYLEPNKPDNEEVLEQAAYQAAVTKQGGDNRNRRYKPRRTVDYMGPMTKWRIDTKLKAVDYMAAIHPNPSDLIGVSVIQRVMVVGPR